jgi:hypothetical protein
LSAFYLEKDVHEVVELGTAEDEQAEDVAENSHRGHQRTQHSVEQRPHLHDESKDKVVEASARG